VLVLMSGEVMCCFAFAFVVLNVLSCCVAMLWIFGCLVCCTVLYDVCMCYAVPYDVALWCSYVKYCSQCLACCVDFLIAYELMCGGEDAMMSCAVT